MLEQQKLHIVTPVLKKSIQRNLLETRNMKCKQRPALSGYFSDTYPKQGDHSLLSKGFTTIFE